MTTLQRRGLQLVKPQVVSSPARRGGMPCSEEPFSGFWRAAIKCDSERNRDSRFEKGLMGGALVLGL